MRLIPQVKKIDIKEGRFNLAEAGIICISRCDSDLLHAAKVLKQRIYTLTGIDIPIGITSTPEMKPIFLSYSNEQCEYYQIRVDATAIVLNGKSGASLFWAVQTFVQIVVNEGVTISLLEISDYPDFSHRGFYHDVTRGKVPRLSTLKTLIEKLSSYKINELQLYIEHSFAFKGIPELWAGKDPLTSEEILELDSYSRKFHIDLIPSLSSFGHLYELLRLKRFEHLNELEIRASNIKRNLWDRMAHYTIDPSNDESFELVKSMIEEYLPLFSSKYFNICCDETFDLGKGKNQKRVSLEGTGPVYFDFVNKLIDLVKRHGKTPMLWGDIIINHPELISRFPQDVIFLNWGYTADIKDDNVRILKDAGVKQYVCPGIQGWSRFAYDINTASVNIRKMINYGVSNNAQGVLNTDWGDCAHVNMFSGLFHGLILCGALSWNTLSYENDEQFDDAVAFLEWGDKSEGVYRILRELGSLCFYHFGNIYAWANGIDGLWNKEEAVKNTDSGLLIKNYTRAKDIIEELIMLRSFNSEKRLEYDECVLSALAVRWTLGLLLYKKKNEYNQEIPINIDKKELIRKGYSNLDESIRIWRIRNKESELSDLISIYKSVLEKIQSL